MSVFSLRSALGRVCGPAIAGPVIYVGHDFRDLVMRGKQPAKPDLSLSNSLSLSLSSPSPGHISLSLSSLSLSPLSLSSLSPLSLLSLSPLSLSLLQSCACDTGASHDCLAYEQLQSQTSCVYRCRGPSWSVNLGHDMSCMCSSYLICKLMEPSAVACLREFELDKF